MPGAAGCFVQSFPGYGVPMADISARITSKSLKAKRKAAIKTIKAQAKEKIREVNVLYTEDPERIKAEAEEREQKKALRIQKYNAHIAYNERQPRQYSFGEDLLNAVSHGVGAALCIAAIVLLVLLAVFHAPEGKKELYTVSYTIFGASLFVIYIFSTLYHALTPYGARRVFSVLTHDAIYVLVAGTYTPFILTKIGGTAGWVVFALIWGSCAVLIALYSVFKAKLRSFSVFTYLLIGWLFLVLFAVTPLSRTLPATSRAFLISGGIAYSVGACFFMMPQYKWTHSIFHLFTLAGSILHFFSVYCSI